MTDATLQTDNDAGLLDAARNIVAMRRLRAEIFPSSMFGEPAWDILLALYAQPAHSEATPESLAEGSGAPVSTAIRWLKYLEEKELVVCDARGDGPAHEQVRLTGKASRALEYFLAQAMRYSHPIS